jgi:hypothetical protein
VRLTREALQVARQTQYATRMMRWRGATDTRQLFSHDWMFDALEQHGMDSPEQARLIASPFRLESRYGEVWEDPLALIVTSERVLIAKKKLGRRIEMKSWFCHHFRDYGTGLWRDSGPGYEIRLNHNSEGRIIIVFKTADEAEGIAHQNSIRRIDFGTSIDLLYRSA